MTKSLRFFRVSQFRSISRRYSKMDMEAVGIRRQFQDAEFYEFFPFLLYALMEI